MCQREILRSQGGKPSSQQAAGSFLYLVKSLAHMVKYHRRGGRIVTPVMEFESPLHPKLQSLALRRQQVTTTRRVMSLGTAQHSVRTLVPPTAWALGSKLGCNPGVSDFARFDP